MERKHAPLPPSQAERWINCPASPKASEGIERQESPYAKEGTTGHWVVDAFLSGQDVQATVCPDTLMEITDEMLEHGERFANKVKEMALGKALHHEVNVYHSDHCWGRLDVAIHCPEVLEIIDYKYGKGVKVSAKDNPQLRIYALAMIRTFAYKPEKIRLSIYQPRADEKNPMDTEEITTGELENWNRKVLLPAIKRTEAEKPEYKAGDWCRWCPALGLCMLAHEEVHAIQKVGGTIALPDPTRLTMEQLGKALQGVGMLEEWVKALEGHAFSILSAGKEIPGFKLVRKRSNRQWTPEGETEIKKLLGEKAFTIPKVISPAQAEKILPDKDMVNGLTCKPEGGLTVAEMEDKREAVSVNPVAEHFTEGLALLE